MKGRRGRERERKESEWRRKRIGKGLEKSRKDS